MLEPKHLFVRQGLSHWFLAVILQAMLESYGGHDRGLRGLDAALNEAAQMVAVSNQRIGDLRKMHALMLLKR